MKSLLNIISKSEYIDIRIDNIHSLYFLNHNRGFIRISHTNRGLCGCRCFNEYSKTAHKCPYPHVSYSLNKLIDIFKKEKSYNNIKLKLQKLVLKKL